MTQLIKFMIKSHNLANVLLVMLKINLSQKNVFWKQVVMKHLQSIIQPQISVNANYVIKLIKKIVHSVWAMIILAVLWQLINYALLELMLTLQEIVLMIVHLKSVLIKFLWIVYPVLLDINTVQIIFVFKKFIKFLKLLQS